MSTHLRPLIVVLAVACAALAAGSGCGEDDSSPAPAASGAKSADTAAVQFTGSVEDGLPTSYPDPKPEKLKIGLLSPVQTSEVVAQLYNASKQQVEELGGEAILLDARQNPDLQVSQFEQLLGQKVDAIATVPIGDPKLMAPLLQRAGKAEIPVIAYEVTPGKPGPVPGFVSQLWQARDKMAYLQAKAVAEALPKGSKLGAVNYALPVPLFEYSKVRIRYWLEKFGFKISANVDSKDDTIPSAQQAATGMIASHPDLAGVLGFVDEAAIGAALAARDAGKRDIKTFGLNATSVGTSAIKSGRLTASVWIDWPALGRQFAKAAYGAAQGLKIPPVVVAPDAKIITAGNVADAAS